jgi:pyruvate/2-oxoglutarate dehydrogenase complex dihydrolipoamide acyltransferase (E2) component
VKRIVAALRRAMSATEAPRPRVVAGIGDPGRVEKVETPAKKQSAGISDPGYSRTEMRTQKILVPIMGEGIRNAKVVTLLKQPGDKIALDDPLCEVETDKAVYPIESSFAGTMGEWKTEVGATVDIGQELGTIQVEGGEPQPSSEPSAERNGDSEPVAEQSARLPLQKAKSAAIEPALSPTIVRRLGRVIPANLQIDARWDAIRSAREKAKKKEGKDAVSPSVMVAWAVVRAMEKHAPFRRIILEDDQIVENDEFDLGIAVALEDDRLATAVVTHANTRDWANFVKSYNETVAETRTGRVDAMNAPVVISSLGAFGVRTGAPIVVPPSVATLFVGSAHYETISDGKKSQPAEVITLSLTFDHRVINGAGAANFVHDVKERIESFVIPKLVAK